ncbi:hypothetical protein Poli38472_010633 [Pythium oligandrum]|uniref:Palmitoyltransferase n=1 Tax=Pythium oligandrum TaxID=41045 RepID=A0A8K1C3F8_PYTOL|nr:hypothetical protein Poli38472_010633 [Pythium oligandrum]|eukprot:TMW55751.1 hypothetical protein Poli38472_010633 [Pythium oligandrum]
MRLICAKCALAGPEAATDASPLAPTCATCEMPLTPPSVFDCARLGLLPELQELIHADLTFDINALEATTNATLLHHAAINSKMRVLEYLVRAFKDTIEIDALGGELQTTPLFWATYHNHIYAVELLLREGADASFTDDAGFCPFLVAIQRCFPILAAYLVAKGTDIDTCVKDELQRSALMLLCQPQRFHLDSFRMVLSLQASVDVQDADGNTALHHAVLNDLGIAVRMLLDNNASPLIENRDGKTPFDLARELLRERSMARHLLEEDRQLQRLSQLTFLRKRWLEDNVYKVSFLVPWIVIPAFAWILATTNGPVLIVLKETLLLMLSMGALKILQRGSYGDKRKAAALMFGINVASIFWLGYALPLFITPEISFALQASIYASIFLILAFLFLTAITDSGTVFTTYQEKLYNIRTLVESKSPSATKLCLTCLHRRPLRAKHCAELNACIAKFDHYCPFVMNAVGAENHHYFVGFLVFAVAGISMALMVCWRYLIAQPDIAWGDGISAFIWSFFHYHPTLVSVMALALLHDLWIGYLLFFHLFLVLASLTTNEFVKHENIDRVYSRGIVENAIDFFRLPGEQRVDWRTMYRHEDFTAVINKAKTE